MKAEIVVEAAEDGRGHHEATGGASQQVASLAVRVTEFSVGPRGRQSLPATLGPGMEYGYGVELSADAAEAAGARAEFYRLVALYVENFLESPVGSEVVSAYFDRERSSWVPSPSGRVVAILSTSGGLADLDTTGDGQSASASELAELGIGDAERQQLALLYAPGPSLWQVAMTHFSFWHYFLPSPLAVPVPITKAPTAGGESPLDPPSITPYSGAIESDNQVFGESLALRGTRFSLHYRSDRVPGRKAPYTLTLPLVGSAVPPGLLRIDLTIDIAGQHHAQSFAPEPNLSHEFFWDRQEGWGREIQGAAPWTATISSVVPGTRGDRETSKTFHGTLGTLDATGAVGLGG